LHYFEKYINHHEASHLSLISTERLKRDISELADEASGSAPFGRCHVTPTLQLLVELLHALAHRLREAVHDVAHHVEVGHVVHVGFLRRRRDGLQLALIGVLHTWGGPTTIER